MVIIHHLGAWCSAIEDIATQKFEEFAPNKCRRPLGATAATPPCARARPRSARVADAPMPWPTPRAGRRRPRRRSPMAAASAGGKVYPPGAILTRCDVLAELPFGNRLVTLDVTGAGLTAEIENGLSRLPKRQRPLSSGLRPRHRGRHQPPARQPCHLHQGRRRTTRPRQELLARHQPLHGARRQRLRDVSRHRASAAGRGLADAGVRGNRFIS
jgi:hypothetical protein